MGWGGGGKDRVKVHAVDIFGTQVLSFPVARISLSYRCSFFFIYLFLCL